MRRTRATGTESSSATSCVCAVSIPCPNSHLPVEAVTVPSAAIASQASSCCGSTCEARVANGPCATPSGAVICTALTPTISAPVPFSTSRREQVARARAARALENILMALPPLGVACDGPQHARMREAPTQDARQRLLDLGRGRMRLLIQQRFGGQDHTAQTKTALCRLLVDERLLQRMRPLERPEPFQRGDVCPGYRSDRRDAGPERAPLGEHGASAALAEPTAELRPAQVEVVAEHVQQRRGRIDIHGM